ncbi:MAG: FliA/WhiG family RNA polymerase sigma factor [Acetomicrobium sp.]|uniref:sigma-70 family RNA polymerase sigma factor n=1 Tax=Acetomicrobium sp. TaxID=1872099 RepID=UPI002B642F63|nr:FliA/WhiG family RNA polymerase sigma factor [Acetomicrobium sp.]
MTKRPTKDVMNEIWRKYVSTHSDELKEEIVRIYLPLVRYVVGRMSVVIPTGLSQDDLLSFGVMGLLDAIDRYDPYRGVSFNTFAFPRIRGAILDELRRYDWFSRSAREKIQRLEKAINELNKQGIKVDDEELMIKLEMDEKELKEIYELMSRSYVVSLDEVIFLEDGEVERGSLVSDNAPTPEEFTESNEECERLKGALEKLPEKEKLVLSLYYYEGLTFKEIGEVIGVTESRISQIHGKALSVLRGLLKKEYN